MARSMTVLEQETHSTFEHQCAPFRSSEGMKSADVVEPVEPVVGPVGLASVVAFGPVVGPVVGPVEPASAGGLVVVVVVVVVEPVVSASIVDQFVCQQERLVVGSVVVVVVGSVAVVEGKIQGSFQVAFDWVEMHQPSPVGQVVPGKNSFQVAVVVAAVVGPVQLVPRTC